MNTILHRQIINNYKKNKFTKEEARQIEKEKYDFLYSEKYLAEHAPYGATKVCFNPMRLGAPPE